MAMKRIYNYIKNLIVTRYKLMRFIATLICLASIISFFVLPTPLISVAFVGGSLASLLRLWTYKTGYIPFIMSDTMWEKIRIRNRKTMSREEMQELYEEKSLKRAAIYFMIATMGFILWILVALLTLLDSLIMKII